MLFLVVSLVCQIKLDSLSQRKPTDKASAAAYNKLDSEVDDPVPA